MLLLFSRPLQIVKRYSAFLSILKIVTLEKRYGDGNGAITLNGQVTVEIGSFRFNYSFF